MTKLNILRQIYIGIKTFIRILHPIARLRVGGKEVNSQKFTVILITNVI